MLLTRPRPPAQAVPWPRPARRRRGRPSWPTAAAAVIVSLLSIRVAWAGVRLVQSVFADDTPDDILVLVSAIVDLVKLAAGCALVGSGWAGVVLAVGLWDGAPLARWAALAISVLAGILALGDLQRWVGRTLLVASIAVLVLLNLPAARRDFGHWIGAARDLAIPRRVAIAALILLAASPVMAWTDAIGRAREARGEIPTATRFIRGLAAGDCAAALAEVEEAVPPATCETIVAYALPWPSAGEPTVVAPIDDGATVLIPTVRDFFRIDVVGGKVTSASTVALAADVETINLLEDAFIAVISRRQQSTITWGVGQARAGSPVGVAFVQDHASGVRCISSISASGTLFMERVAARAERTYASGDVLPPCDHRPLGRGYGR